jgi:hypothetical protein
MRNEDSAGAGYGVAQAATGSAKSTREVPETGFPFVVYAI